MERRKLERSALVLMLISVLAVVILVANLDDTDLGGNDGSSQEMVDDVVNGLLPIALVLAGLMFLYIVISVLGRRTRMSGGGQKNSRSSILPLFIMMVGIVICGLVLLYAGPLGGNPDIDMGNNTNGTDGGVDDGDGGGTTYNMYTIIGILALVIIIMIPLVRYLKGQGAFTKDRTPPGQIEQVEVLDQAILDIGYGTGDLRETILRAYYEMCRLIPFAVDHGALTPREFAELSVRDLGWPEKAVRGLTEVFEVARYSQHDLGDEDRAKALRCLAEIKEKVAPGVTGPVGTADPIKG
jgi:hypothetical protein